MKLMSLLVAPGIRIADRYTLGEKLGSGGQGEVWMAFDELQREAVALKILTRTFDSGSDPRDVLKHEYSVVCDLDHPRILPVYPPLCVGEHAILPMKLATGGDLRQLRGAPYLEIVPALIDLAHALAHAHAHGVVHRDLKPANVLFDGTGRIQLAGFGVAGRAEEALSIDEARSGWSPSSASPQQLSGLPATPADDLYGLGALAFELLTGTPPYFPDFEVRRVLEEPVPAIEPVHVAPASLLALIRCLLAKNPRHRMQSMGEVISALTAALDDPPTWEYSNLGASARELAVTSDVIPEC
jgi:serine/threonine-protein kinase